MSMNRINNPSQLPQGVVEGYQQQNTNMFAARVGLDTTAPFDNGTVITVPIGGVVEANGVMYSVASEWSQTKPNADTAYWIVVVPSENGLTASFELVTRPGVWSPGRNGCYFTSGDFNNCRTLNWVSRGTLANMPTANPIFSVTVKGPYTVDSLGQKGWHVVRLGSGLGGGFGGNGDGVTGGFGGVANSRSTFDVLIFHDGWKTYQGKIGGNGFNGQSGGSTPAPIAGSGGGGGGSGGGSETTFESFSSGEIMGGRGGNGGGTNGGTGGNPGESGGGGGGNGSRRFDLFRDGGGGGRGALAGGTGGGGGNGGRNGFYREDGTPGGFCNIFLLGN